MIELYFTLYHGCYILVLLLSSHEWIMLRYWTSVVILTFVKRSHFTLYLSQGLVAMYCTSITVVTS